MTNQTMGKSILTFLFAILMFSCSQPKENIESTEATQVDVASDVIEKVELPAVCIWDKVTAKFASTPLSIEDNQEKIEAIDEILENVDLSDSKFIAAVEEAVETTEQDSIN